MTKPYIPFEAMPECAIWIKAEYEKVLNLNDMVKFIHWCLDESEVSKNEIRSKTYYTVASCLFGLVTLKSYESAIVI